MAKAVSRKKSSFEDFQAAAQSLVTDDKTRAEVLAEAKEKFPELLKDWVAEKRGTVKI